MKSNSVFADSGQPTKDAQAIETAKNYLGRGWHPLPIPYRAKAPILKSWETLTITGGELDNYFNGKSQNIGVLLGERSNGLTDIDLDSAEAVKIADYFLPKTDSVFGRTSKPRSHRLYYGDSAYYEKFNNPFLLASKDGSVRKTACIVEIRGKNGLQTVFPGSAHEGGELITWQTDGDPTQIKTKSLRQAVARLASACLISTFWRPGIRQDLAMALTGSLLRNGFTEAETENFLRAVCSAANDEETELRIKAFKSTVRKLKSNEKAYGLPKLAELTDKKLVETVCEWLGLENKDGPPKTEQTGQSEKSIEFTSIPKPLDFTLRPVATIEDEMLPSILVNWLRPASRAIGCPFGFLVLSVIVSVGSLIGSRLRVKALPNSDWLIVPNLYSGIVGLPSSKKTPALDEARKIILELQNEAREAFLVERKTFENESKWFEKKKTEALKEAKSKEDYTKKLEALEKEFSSEPIQRRFEVNDVTASKLIQFLAQNPNGLLQFRDELAGWLKSLDAEYNQNARPLILELWKGGCHYELARMGENREDYLRSGTLAIIGGVQPAKLQKYVAEAYSFDNSDGFLQRFLWDYSDAVRTTTKPTKEDFTAMASGYQAAKRVIKRLASYDFGTPIVLENGDRVQALKFDLRAQEVFDKWKEEIEKEAIELEKEDEVFASFLFKLPKSCAAIALIFHCLEKSEADSLVADIGEDSILKAVSYIDVLITHARRVFALGENRIFSLANNLLAKIKNGNLKDGFTARDISRKQWSGLGSGEIVADVLTLLVDYGWLKDCRVAGSHRPSIHYFMHPDLSKFINSPEVPDED